MGRKVDGEATLHLGRHATAQERRGSMTELGELNRQIIAANENRKQIRKQFADHQAARRQLRDEVKEHVRDATARHAPETGRREAEAIHQAEHTAAKSDRRHGPPEGRGGPDQAAKNAADRRHDAGRAIGRAGDTAGKAAGKAVSGTLGVVEGLLGALLGNRSSGSAKSPQQSKAAKPPRSLEEILSEVQAKQGRGSKPSPEKEREPDTSRSRFVEVRPATRFFGVLADYAGWAVEARARLVAYARRTGEDVAADLRELDKAIYFAGHSPKPRYGEGWAT